MLKKKKKRTNGICWCKIARYPICRIFFFKEKKENNSWWIINNLFPFFLFGLPYLWGINNQMLTSVRKQKLLTDSFNLSVTYINFTLKIKKKNKLMLSWNYKFNDLHEKWQGGYSLINCQVAPAFEKWSAKIQAAYQPKASAIPVPRHQQWFIIGGTPAQNFLLTALQHYV